MNTKFFAYTTAAIIIGFAVMMLPFVLERELPSPIPQYTSTMEGAKGQRYPDNTGTYASQPYSITSYSLILLTGLIIAFTAYILVKRQLSQQPTTLPS